jgi:hypothetical protein
MPTPNNNRAGTDGLKSQEVLGKLHQKLSPENNDGTRDSFKQVLIDSVQDEIAKADLSKKDDFERIVVQNNIAVNVFGQKIKEILAGILTNATPEEQTTILAELTTELGLDEEIVALKAAQTFTAPDGTVSTPSDLKVFSDAIAKRYSFMAISVKSEEDGAPVLTESGEMSPNALVALKSGVTLYKTIYSEDSSFTTALRTYANSNPRNGRPLYRLTDLNQNPPFRTQAEFDGWRAGYEKNLKELYLVAQDLPFYTNIGHPIALKIAEFSKVKKEFLDSKRGNLLIDCKYIQGLDLLHRNSMARSLRDSTVNNENDIFYSAESYSLYRQPRVTTNSPETSEVSAPPSTARDVIFNIINSFNGNVGSFNRGGTYNNSNTVGGNNSVDIGPHLIANGDNLNISFDNLSADQLNLIMIDLTQVFGSDRCSLVGDTIILINVDADNSDQPNLDLTAQLRLLRENGIDVDRIDQATLQAILIQIARFNLITSNQVRVSANRVTQDLILDCNNATLSRIFVQILTRSGIRNVRLEGNRIIIIIINNNYRGRTPVQPVSHGPLREGELFGNNPDDTGQSKYHELLEDGKTAESDIKNAREARLGLLQTRLSGHIASEHRSGVDVNTGPGLNKMITGSLDLCLKDADQLFVDRQQYRLSKQGAITKGFNQFRNAINLPKWFLPVGKIALGVGTYALAGPAAGMALGIGLTTLALRRPVSEMLAKARMMGAVSTTSHYNNLAIAQQLNLRKSITPGITTPNESEVYKENVSRIKKTKTELHKSIKSKLAEPHNDTILRDMTVSPQVKQELITKILIEEQERIYNAMEAERDKLNKIRAAEWLGALASAAAISMLVKAALGGIGGGDPEPIKDTLTPDPVKPPFDPTIIEGKPPVITVPPIPDPVTVPPIPDPVPVPVPPIPDPVTVPPIPDPVTVPPIVPEPSNVISIHDADYLHTFQQNYDPSTALVDKINPNDILGTASDLSGVDVVVDTHQAGSVGNLNVRFFENGELVESSLNLTDGNQVTLTGNEMSANVYEATNNQMTPMRYFEVQMPSGQTGYVNGAFLDRATPLEIIPVFGTDTVATTAEAASTTVQSATEAATTAANTNVETPIAGIQNASTRVSSAVDSASAAANSAPTEAPRKAA